MVIKPIAHQTVLSLGTNLGDRLLYIEQAKQQLQSIGKIISASKVYESPPWQGDEQQDNFYNQILQFTTALDAFSLLYKIREIETVLGRKRNTKWEARQIDIDILFFDQSVIQQENLSIPHPLIQERNFILIPMIEMGLDYFVHPVLQQTIQHLYDKSSDKSLVMPLKESS